MNVIAAQSASSGGTSGAVQVGDGQLHKPMELRLIVLAVVVSV